MTWNEQEIKHKPDGVQRQELHIWSSFYSPSFSTDVFTFLGICMSLQDEGVKRSRFPRGRRSRLLKRQKGNEEVSHYSLIKERTPLWLRHCYVLQTSLFGQPSQNVVIIPKGLSSLGFGKDRRSLFRRISNSWVLQQTGSHWVLYKLWSRGSFPLKGGCINEHD